MSWADLLNKLGSKGGKAVKKELDDTPPQYKQDVDAMLQEAVNYGYDKNEVLGDVIAGMASGASAATDFFGPDDATDVALMGLGPLGKVGKLGKIGSAMNSADKKANSAIEAMRASQEARKAEMAAKRLKAQLNKGKDSDVQLGTMNRGSRVKEPEFDGMEQLLKRLSK